MRKITFLLTLLLMYVGVTPMMADAVVLDENKTYTISLAEGGYYLYADVDRTYVTYDSNTSYVENDNRFHFKFVPAEVASDGSQVYYIQTVADSKYVYRKTISGRYYGYLNANITTSNNKWVVLEEGDAYKIALYRNSAISNYYWYPWNGSELSISSGSFKKLQIKALDGSEVGGGESGGNEGGGSEGEPEDQITYFRLKEKSTGKYFTIINNEWNTGATSGVNLSALNYANDNQVFTREASDVGFKLKAKTGYYVKLHQWNVNANTTSADEATMIRFNEVGENEFTFSWNNTFSSYALNYIKVQYVGGTYYPFCDAAEAYAATWILEELPKSINLTLAEISDTDELLYGLKGYIGSFSAPYATLIPDGVEAYYATSKDNMGYITLTPCKATATSAKGVPANFGVILVSQNQNITLTPASHIDTPANNVFGNSAGKEVEIGAGDYILASGKQGIGFYESNPGTLAKNKAFLRLGTSQTSALRLVLDETVTGINGVATEKVDAPIYDLSGRRVLNTVRGGIYIQNGKKFIVI